MEDVERSFFVLRDGIEEVLQASGQSRDDLCQTNAEEEILQHCQQGIKQKVHQIPKSLPKVENTTSLGDFDGNWSVLMSRPS